MIRTGSSTLARSLNTRAQVAVGEAAGRGVGGVELDERAALGRAVLGQLRVAGVEEAGVVLGRQQLQREARRSVGVAARALAGRRRTSAAPAGRSRAQLLADELDACPTRSGTRRRAHGRPSSGIRHA